MSRKPNGAASDKPRDLNELLPSRDPLVIQRVAEELHLVGLRDEAKTELELRLRKKANAAANLRAQNLLKAQGGPADVDRATQDRDRADLGVKEQKEFIVDLESTLFDARLGTTAAKGEAIKRANAAATAEGRAEVIARDQLHELLIPHVARCREIHEFLETIAAEAKRLEITECTLSPQASLVLYGACPQTNSASWLTDLFVPDPNAPRYGGLGLWKHAAILSGLLEPTAASKAEHDRDKKRRADDMVRSALAEGWARRRLDESWGDTDKRNLSLSK